MPKFDRVPLGEAKMKTTSGKRAQIIAEYVRYIEQLGDGEAGRLFSNCLAAAPSLRRTVVIGSPPAARSLPASPSPSCSM